MADKFVSEFENTDVGMYAVFRRAKGRAHFKALHLTYDQAEAEAIRLTAQSAQQSPTKNILFFVVRLESFVQFSNGKMGRGVAHGPHSHN